MTLTPATPPSATLASQHALVSHYFQFARRTVIEAESLPPDSDRPTFIAAVIILVVGAVEAYLNIVGRLWLEQVPNLAHADRILDDLERRVPFGKKLRTWPELLFGRPLALDAGTPKEFAELVELRNHLMHFTSTYDTLQVENVTVRGLTDMTRFYQRDAAAGRNAVDLAESTIFELIRLQGLSEERVLLAGTMWTGRPALPQELESARARDRARAPSSLLIAAAAPRNLSAFRYTAAATMTKALWFSGARATASQPKNVCPIGAHDHHAVGFRWVKGSRLRASRPARPPLSNTRLKLSGRGGRLVGKGSLLIAAAPARSLSAIR